MRTSNRFAATILLLLVISIAVSACAQPSIAPSPTFTPNPSTATPTVKPTQTPIPSQTATITLTNTATATISPTFGLAPPATITPQPRVDCPPVDPSAALDPSSFRLLNDLFIRSGEGKRIEESSTYIEDLQLTYSDLEQNIKNYLNSGGAITELQTLFEQHNQSSSAFYTQAMLAEVTGDNVPEVFAWVAMQLEDHGLSSPMAVSDSKGVFSAVVQHSKLFIFSCKEYEYKTIWEMESTPYPPGELELPTVLDLNADGINEIVQPSYVFAGSGYYFYLRIFAWDGSQFINRIDEKPLLDPAIYFWDYSGISNKIIDTKGGQFEFIDIDNNSTLEVVISGIERAYISCQLLYRETRIALRWNGENYSGFFWWTPPIYRAQAVWDADHMASRGFYEDALSLYNMAIFEEALLPWSPEYNNLNNPLCDFPDADPIPTNPQLDKDELDRIVAYALYRTMLIYTAMSDQQKAQSIYDELMAGYQLSPASIYAELGSTFWKEYSASSDLGKACNSAIEFATNNLEVLTIANVFHQLLDSSDRSGQTLNDYPWPAPDYQPKDICPFGSQ